MSGIKLGSNISSLAIQRNLVGATQDLHRAAERLSSGQRINRPSDDAAALSISSALEADVRVLTQGLRNINDGLSISAVSTSALQAMQEISSRQRELAVQAANSLYSQAQRAALADETSKLTNEYNRIISSTSFNGIQLLENASQSIVIQAGGSGVENTLSFNAGAKLATGAESIGQSQGLGGIQSEEGGVTPGSYIMMSGGGRDYYAWFTVDGVGSNPSPELGAVGSRVDLSSGIAAPHIESINFADASYLDIYDDRYWNYADSTALTLYAPEGTFTVKFDTNGSHAAPGANEAWVSLGQNDTGADIAAKTKTALESLGAFGATTNSNQLTVTNNTGGLTAGAQESSGGISTSTVHSGSDSGSLVQHQELLTFFDANDGFDWLYADGDTVLLYAPEGTFSIKFDTGGGHAPAGPNEAWVSLAYEDDGATIASKTKVALESLGVFSVQAAGTQLTVTNLTGGFAPGALEQAWAISASTVVRGTSEATLEGLTRAVSDVFSQTGAFSCVTVSSGVIEVTANAGSFNIDASGDSGADISVNQQGAGPILAGTGILPCDVATGDFNGDGRTDFVTTDYGDQKVSVFINEGDGSFTPTRSYYTYRVQSVTTADFNGDGYTDFATTSDNDYGTNVFMSNGNGTFANAVHYSSPAVTAYGGIGSADFNGDNDPDIVFTGGGAAHVLLNSGSGAFTWSGSATMGTYSISIATGDIDSDGDIDLVTGDGDTDVVSVFLNNGNGTFATRVSYTASDNAVSVGLADFNGDSKLDLVALGQYGNSVDVRMNTGTGSFGSRITYWLGAYASANDLAIGDFNADGKADFGITETAKDVATIFFNNGSGTFSTKVSYATGDVPGKIAAADFNGDGKTDFITADQVSNRATIQINNGDGTFPQMQQEITTIDLTSIFTAGDPDPDPGSGGGSADGPTTITDPDVSTPAAALDSIGDIDERMERISDALGAVGAVESRLRVAFASLQSSRENFQGARARMIDADMAHETAVYVRAKILQELASSVLANANQDPAIALKLIS